MTLGTGGTDRFEGVRRSLGAGQLDEALASLEAMLAAHPEDAEAQALTGIALGMRREFAWSLRHLETATQLAPQQASYFFNLGQIREQSGDPSGAVAAYRQALQISPSYERAAQACRRLTGAPSQPAGAAVGFEAPAAAPRPAAAAPWLDPQYAAAASRVETPVYVGPRRIADAPQIVKSIRWLYGLAIFILLLGGLGLVLGGPSSNQGPAETLAVLVFVCLFLCLYVWLMVAVPRGNKIAYYVQLVFSILGLLGFPLGTLLNGYILYHWFQPETKAWFDVS